MGFYEDRVFPILLRRAVRHFSDDREGVITEATGRVLEIGIGGGENLPHYTPRVSHVVAIDTSWALLSRARGRSVAGSTGKNQEAHASYQAADAVALPFQDASFDTAVSFLVFCSIGDPLRAAAEAHRVLKPGGKLLFFEHVRASDGTLAWLQDHLNPIWTRFACGCNLNRDTRSTFEQAGFQIAWITDEIESVRGRVRFPMMKGAAVKPG